MPADLIEFYRGDGVDSEGRRLEEILAWDYIDLELVHDFIQWLFPLPEPSQFNAVAPLLTPEQMKIVHVDPQIRENVLRSLEKLLGFYGFTLNRQPHLEIKESELFAHRQHVLYGGFNHNHLRITRILRSLTLLGLQDLARLFLTALKASDRGRMLPQRSIEYWDEAVVVI
jgi:Opioid growth factor receptor (OGFr) conserved region